MIENIDRNKVRTAFHRQASDYDSHAIVQARVVARMSALLQEEAQSPSSILDIGAGTGNLLAELRRLYPKSTAVGADLALGMCRAASKKLHGKVQLINADAERLPFAAGSFDLVVSTSTYQWLSTLDHAFADVKRVLRRGGLFCFALFGERTLFELRESYRKVLDGAHDRTHNFFSRAEALAALQRAGFADPRVTSEMEVELHPDVPELLRSLKRIGAANASSDHSKGLSQRRMMLNMMEVYRQSYERDGEIPASYEVLYGVGRV